MGTISPQVLHWPALGRKIKLERYLLYCGDLVIAALAFSLALFLQEQAGQHPFESRIFGIGLAFFLPICAVSFPISGLYNRYWRYASITDLMVITRAVLLASLIFVAAMYLFAGLEAMPKSVAIIQIFILISFLGAVRLAFRIDEIRRLVFAYLGSERVSTRVPVLLVGAGRAGDHYLRALGRDPNAAYKPVGFLDDDPQSENLTLRGVPVLGRVSDFKNVLTSLRCQGRIPQRIIFTGGDLEKISEYSQELIDIAHDRGIAVSKVPSPMELRDPHKDGEIELRPIEVTDLLERPQTTLDRKLIADFVKGQRIVVTGAGGSIGRELVKQIAAFQPAEIVLIDNCEFNLYTIDRELLENFPDVIRFIYLCDIREQHRVDEIFDKHYPELVFNAAALKHVPMVEINPCEGFLTNVTGAQIVAEAAKRCKVRAFIQISTDKAVDSTSVMGATKRLAELFCQALDLDEANRTTRFMTVRFGNVLGSSGSLVPLFQRQLALGGPLTITDPKMTRFFMTIREAVELTLQSSAHALAGDIGQGMIFVLDMGDPIKIIDLATRMIRLAGLRPGEDVEIEIIGRRPGEKLFEELFDQSEKQVNLPIPGVLGALHKPISLECLQERFCRMKDHARTGDTNELFRLMSEIIPKYQPEFLCRNGTTLHTVHNAPKTLSTAWLKLAPNVQPMHEDVRDVKTAP